MQFTVLAGATNATNLMNVNQQRSTFSPNVTFAAPFIVSTNAATGAKTCTHWQAYVDVASGELLAEVSSCSNPHPTPKCWYANCTWCRASLQGIHQSTRWKVKSWRRRMLIPHLKEMEMDISLLPTACYISIHHQTLLQRVVLRDLNIGKPRLLLVCNARVF